MNSPRLGLGDVVIDCYHGAYGNCNPLMSDGVFIVYMHVHFFFAVASSVTTTHKWSE